MHKIEKREIKPRVFLLKFKTQYQLAATFLRFQEHYESRKFAGKVFTIEEFMDWYVQENGRFSYFEDWAGFNVPSAALVPFSSGDFDPLLEKEKQLLELFQNESGDFYIIGVLNKGDQVDTETLAHELVHAKFHLDKKYRREVLAAIKRHDTVSLEEHLGGMGYHRRVLKDEVNAYLVSGDEDLPRKFTSKLKRLKKELISLHQQYEEDGLQ
jgi:hypothetical protein